MTSRQRWALLGLVGAVLASESVISSSWHGISSGRTKPPSYKIYSAGHNLMLSLMIQCNDAHNVFTLYQYLA